MVFKNGSITFCDDEDNPHWKINASRIYLLPGEEFALFNMTLYVGVIPILWLPGFYYPKDELVFNPVFGSDPRRGYYVQTTTYLVGRKPLAVGDNDSSFNFMKLTTLKKQRREGLMLHNLDENLGTPPADYLKFAADYYSNQGTLLGLEGSFKPPKNISKLDLSFYTGFSNVIFDHSGVYTIYAPVTANYQTYSEKGYFFGIEMPFRYKSNFAMTMTKPFSLTVALPAYSDTYFESDFLRREETMDWMSYITSNKLDEEPVVTAGTEISSFNWSLRASSGIPVGTMTPFISSLSVTYGFNLLFASALDTTVPSWVSGNSSRGFKFYYPQQLTPINLTASMSGTLLSVPWRSRQPRAISPESRPSGLVPPTDIKPDTPTADTGGETAGSAAVQDSAGEVAAGGAAREETGETATEAAPDGETPEAGTVGDPDPKSEEPWRWLLPKDDLPAMTAAAPAAARVGGTAYSLGYTFTPSFVMQSTYPAPLNDSGTSDPRERTLDTVQSSMYILKPNTTFNSSLSWRDGFWGITNAINVTPTIQDHTVLLSKNDDSKYGLEESAIRSARISDYSATKLEIASANMVSFKPFVYSRFFSNTGLSWNSSVKLLRSEFKQQEFIDNGYTDPQWDYITPKWDEQSWTAHTLSLTVAAADGPLASSLSFTSNLPPQLESYTGALSAGYTPLITVRSGTGIKRKSKQDPTWVWDMFTQSATLSFFASKLSINQSYSYDIENDAHSNFQTSLSGYGLSLAYTAQRTRGYELDRVNKKWEQKENLEFLPVSLSFSYSHSGKEVYTWKNRTKFLLGGSTNLFYDMQRPTSSYFTFAPRFIFDVTQFLHVAFVATSRNNVIFRYFQDSTQYAGLIPGETNVFTDLFNSFALWDQKKREASGFKLQTLSVEVIHELHDWLLSANLTITPTLRTPVGASRPYIDTRPTFSIAVVWRPMSSIKATVQDKDGVFRLNPGSAAQ
ncbi:MAG: hypothetical protein LBS64_05450, partial [Spirochaetaceae bacterium]|jgi:hypothetical protein|nr:hypothetical protein [Spirochaetaceae bacterium]